MGNIYIGVSNIARKVSNIYIGINNIAKKVSKGYIGVNNIAKLFYNSSEWIHEWSTIYSNKRMPASCAFQNTQGNNLYAIFAGGGAAKSESSTVEKYDTSLTHSSVASLREKKTGCAAVFTTSTIFVGGGCYYTNRYYYTSSVEMYENSSLTKTSASNLTAARANLAATSTSLYRSSYCSGYAIFLGGYNSSESNVLDCYLNDGTLYTSLTTTGRHYLAATRVRKSEGSSIVESGRAIFGGGVSNTQSSNYVETYDNSLTKQVVTSLSVARYGLSATTVGDYALFGGGINNNITNAITNVDVYNTSLTKGNATNLSIGRYYLSATTVGDYALFGGGYSNASNSTVETYDTSLIKGTAPDLSEARMSMGATTVGNYALFGGGTNASSDSNVLDYYSHI